MSVVIMKYIITLQKIYKNLYFVSMSKIEWMNDRMNVSNIIL